MITGIHPTLEAAADALLADTSGIFTERQMDKFHKREVFVDRLVMDRHDVDSLRAVDRPIYNEYVRARPWMRELVYKAPRPLCEREGCTVRPFKVTNGLCSKHQPPKGRPQPTHCGRGHEWTPATTYIRKDTGTRQCRQCENDRAQAKREARPGYVPMSARPKACYICGGKVEAKGLCRPHYDQARHPTTPRVTRLCDEDGCENRHFGRGLCHKHYQRERARGRFAKNKAVRKICAREGCEKDTVAKGLCRTHYSNYLYHKNKGRVSAPLTQDDIQRAQKRSKAS